MLNMLFSLLSFYKPKFVLVASDLLEDAEDVVPILPEGDL
jgi:hypothetical protein